jgi:hypothetical protein
METVPVESSNIARIGYSYGVLRIEFRSGAVYDYEATPAEHAALMASPTKSRWVRENLSFRRAVRQERTATAETPGVISPESSTLHSFEPDECCGPHLTKAAASGRLEVVDKWTCQRCGCEFRAIMVGDIKSWQPVPMIEVFRP